MHRLTADLLNAILCPALLTQADADTAAVSDCATQAADVISMLGSGMSVRFFSLFFWNGATACSCLQPSSCPALSIDGL